MRRADAVGLYERIVNLKGWGLETATFIKIVKIRLVLKRIYDSFMDFQREAAEQSKPKNWKEGDPRDVWDEKYSAAVRDWLGQEEKVDTHILSMEECVAYIKGGQDTEPEEEEKATLKGYDVDYIIGWLWLEEYVSGS